MKQLLASLVIIGTFGGVQAGNMIVSLEDIVLLSQRDVSDETILVLLQNREIGFTLGAKDVDSLLEAGVSEEVIRYLLQKTASAPLPTYAPVTYVVPYPSYYYRPYYSGTSLYRHHYYGVGHHRWTHAPASLHFAHTGGGHSRGLGHRSSSIGHRSIGHRSSGGHSRSHSFGHRGGHSGGHGGGH
ncbi:hypothetical protein MNBD_GAMMA13-1023 [hydrothermal vent metagenome]|uniref:Uncharacterized protein n=1 Tax=hydrothermal vent metagenome TaxID=652676 RepID=A0A3B0YJZ3_9ZZZZ